MSVAIAAALADGEALTSSLHALRAWTQGEGQSTFGLPIRPTMENANGMPLVTSLKPTTVALAGLHFAVSSYVWQELKGVYQAD